MGYYSWTSKIWDTHGLQKYRILIDFKKYMGYSWTSKIWDTHGLQKYRILDFIKYIDIDFKNTGYSWTSKIWDTHGLQKYRDTGRLQKIQDTHRHRKYRILIDFMEKYGILTHGLQKNTWILMDFKNMGYSWTSKIWDTHGLQKYGILMDFKNMG